MYKRYCEKKGWKLSVTDANPGTVGGYKEIDFAVEGDNVYGTLKYESGVHRVQRVPATETQGRMHTSAATVAVLPEAEKFEVHINEGDIKWDTLPLVRCRRPERQQGELRCPPALPLEESGDR